MSKQAVANQLVLEAFEKDPFDPKVERDKYIEFRKTMIRRIAAAASVPGMTYQKVLFSHAFKAASGGRLRRSYTWNPNRSTQNDPLGHNVKRYDKSIGGGVVSEDLSAFV